MKSIYKRSKLDTSTDRQLQVWGCKMGTVPVGMRVTMFDEGEKLDEINVHMTRDKARQLITMLQDAIDHSESY